MEKKKELYLKIRNEEGVSESDMEIILATLGKTDLSVQLVNTIDRTVENEIKFSLKDILIDINMAFNRIEQINELIKSKYKYGDDEGD